MAEYNSPVSFVWNKSSADHQRHHENTAFDTGGRLSCDNYFCNQLCTGTVCGSVNAGISFLLFP